MREVRAYVKNNFNYKDEKVTIGIYLTVNIKCGNNRIF